MLGWIWVVWFAVSLGLWFLGRMLRDGKMKIVPYLNWYFVLMGLWTTGMVAFIVAAICKFTVMLWTPWV